MSYEYRGIMFEEKPQSNDKGCQGCAFDDKTGYPSDEDVCYRIDEFPAGCSDRETIWVEVV